MAKIPLGGVKILKGRSCLTSFSRSEDRLMVGMCQRLAMEQINISLLTYLEGNRERNCVASFCTEGGSTLSAYFLLKPDQDNPVKLQSDLSVLSIFPYHEMAEIVGMLIRLLACMDIRPYALASSLSAISVVIPSSDVEVLIDGLFDGFEFPSYKSIVDWYAAYEGQERLLKQIICSYREEIIKVYNLTVQTGLDIWVLEVPFADMDRFAYVLSAMGELDIRIPYMTAQEYMEEILLTACCFDADRKTSVAQIIERRLRGVNASCVGPVAALYLHGPHFGDRYGIADALTGSLQKGLVQPLAVSCAVSSVSVVVWEKDMDMALEALNRKFQIPEMIRI
jgi:aspartokinase